MQYFLLLLLSFISIEIGSVSVCVHVSDMFPVSGCLFIDRAKVACFEKYLADFLNVYNVCNRDYCL